MRRVYIRSYCKAVELQRTTACGMLESSGQGDAHTHNDASSRNDGNVLSEGGHTQTQTLTDAHMRELCDPVSELAHARLSQLIIFQSVIHTLFDFSVITDHPIMKTLRPLFFPARYTYTQDPRHIYDVVKVEMTRHHAMECLDHTRADVLSHLQKKASAKPRQEESGGVTLPRVTLPRQYEDEDMPRGGMMPRRDESENVMSVYFGKSFEAMLTPQADDDDVL